MSRVAPAILALSLLLGACQSGPDPKGDGAPAESAPKMNAHGIPEAGALGTLPEGVGIPPGAQAPASAALTLEGEEVRLDSLWAEGPIALIFYRGGWCPFCNFQIHELSQAYPGFAERGVTPVAVSVDQPDVAAQSQATFEIPFPVLSDSDLSAHIEYQVLNEVGGGTYRMMRLFGYNLEEWSGEDHHTVAIPSIFIIDGDGVVRWAHAETDYTLRPSPEQLFAVIDGLGLNEMGD